MTQADRATLLREPNFRWLIGGSLVSALGDQFTLVALPWLVLALTGDALALGLVVALMSLPRAVFMLAGGALVDRHSPKSVLMLSKYANAILLAILAALVLAGEVSMAAVYLLALGLGLASAFSIPAGTSMMPTVVAPAQLPAANGILMGVHQLSMLSGPLLAALVFAVFGDGSTSMAAADGLGIAFAFDALTFAVTIWTLSRVRPRPAAPAPVAPGMLRAVAEGLATVWRDAALRNCMLYWAVCAFVVGGMMQVALPVLAASRLEGGAALGLLMGAHGAGSLLGMTLTGMRGKIRIGTFGTSILLADAVSGLLVLLLGLVASTWQAAGVLLLLGVVGGLVQVAVFSWLQQRVPRAMLGRAMSIFMFIFMGLAPMSAALTGYALRFVSLTQLITGAGMFLVCYSALAWVFTPIGRISDADAPPRPGAAS